ncbi:MAG TPA: glycosyltransferase [Planctomycetota bacterium]|nr:glycosyltransferase [Planctomycetota bacterium]
MRVLQLIHDYLPRHAAGSEIYTAHLCAALRAAGHEVAVFTCEEDRGAAQWSLRERVHDGVPVFEGVYNRIYADLSEQWDDPRMAAVLDGVLERWRPDLLHVQGLQFVGGVSALRAAAARGIPVVMTLHEYWLLCPRAGLMFDVAGRACEVATPTDCARCVDVYPIDRMRWSDARHGGGSAADDAIPDAPDKPASGSFAELGNRRWFARALVRREADLRAAAGLVGRFIAPSAFLAERFAAAGFPRERIVHADYGFPAPPGGVTAARAARQARRARREPLRVGYVGTLSDYKGVEVFARAVQRAAAGDRASAGSGVHGGARAFPGYGEHAVAPLRASIHGHLDWFPDVTARLRAIAARCGGALDLAGPFAQERRDAVLAELDLLVVPSLWWENSPLTIHEAWQRGLPVLASARGGMAELLAQGGGATFPPGDDAALSALLLRAARDPTLLARWTASIPPVRALDEDVVLLQRLARDLGVTAR